MHYKKIFFGVLLIVLGLVVAISTIQVRETPALPSSQSANTLQTTSSAPAPAPLTKKSSPPKPKIKTPASNPQVSCGTTFNEQFLCIINEHRAKNGKKPLSYDSKLDQVAILHSMWMKKNETLSHTGENNSKFYERCADLGTTCLAENAAMGFTSVKNLFEMWKESEAHNNNMLGDYAVMGLGISGNYATNIFR